MMTPTQPITRDLRRRPKTLLAVAGVGVVCVMGMVTAAFGANQAVDRSITIVNADPTSTAAGPTATTFTAPTAAPTLKSPAFVGGDWPGFGH
jgi:hypothetical protein